MSLFKEFQSRQIQKKANNFIKSLKNKSEKEVEQSYLETPEFENNEIVLSYLFFNYPSLIRIMPLEFQKSRINSNLSMFNKGSEEAKKQLISSWISGNKFFMNANNIGLSEEETKEYLKEYFKQPDDIPLLFMDDLSRVISVLSECDLKQTENIIKSIKDKFNDKQWEFIIKVNPLFIKYASQEVQKEKSSDEKYAMYLSGEARGKYIESQLEKIEDNLELLKEADVDIQKEYVVKRPYVMNYLDTDTITNILKYDINMIKYVNLSLSKNKNDGTHEIISGILDNIQNKSNKEIVNILVNKCVLNAKGKLYRFDPKSHDISYQYTKRIMRKIQTLTVDQIITLIMIDANYILPYVAPIYSADTSKEEKEKIIIDSNLRCLNVFKVYFGTDIYAKYYKVINKIFNEYLAHYEEYDFSKDYRCILELLKILFNKNIIKKNNFEKISIYISTSLMYKNNATETSKKLCVKLLNEIISTAYGVKVDNNKEIYNINSLELFDEKLSFISKDLLDDFSKYNFVNISNLLLIIKSDKIYDIFKMYYNVIIHIYGENKEALYRIIENFNYYKSILSDVKDKELNNDELDNLTILLSTFFNPYKIEKKEELEDYDIISLKKVVSELSTIKDEEIFKNILCNFLFNKSYDEKGDIGWLETDTIKQVCDIYDIDALRTLKINQELVFSDEEVNLFAMTKLLFSVNDFDLLISFLENIITNKVQRNILSTMDLFTKLKKYRVPLINNQVVALSEIEDLYNSRPDIVLKNKREGVDVYTIINQDFKILCSENDDGSTYDCLSVSTLDKNVYAYDRLIEDKPIRFISDDNNVLIRVNEDSYSDKKMEASYIVITSKLTSDLLEIAKENNLTIVEIQN